MHPEPNDVSTFLLQPISSCGIKKNLADCQLAILVLPTTNWLEIAQHQSKVAAVVNALRTGEYHELRW